jgi:hypothetical protein
MAVHYTGGGGLLDSLMSAAGMAAMFVPGLQPFMPYINAAAALAKGNVAGAVGSVAAPMIGKAISGAAANAATPMNNALTLAQRTQFQPPDIADYISLSQPKDSFFDALTRFDPQTEFQRKWRR